MNNRLQSVFLMLVLFQALHSWEEYIGKLWQVFLPAEILTGLISKDHEKGFLIINVGLFVFGCLGWLFFIRKNVAGAGIIVWFWIIIELINGLGHPIWSIYQGAYTPGILTAPILLILAIYLIKYQRT